MDDEDRQQERIHEALNAVLRENDVLEDDDMLVGWCISYETVKLSDATPDCGQVYGPRGMTTWRALGLLEWVRRFCLGPPEGDDDDEDEA